MRAWRAGALSVRMPQTPNRQLLRLLMAEGCNRPAIEPRECYDKFSARRVAGLGGFMNVYADM